LPAELASASTYAERFDYTVIDWLPPDDVRQALVTPADQSGHSWSEDGYRRVYEVSHGYPYFVQLYASEAWAALNLPREQRSPRRTSARRNHESGPVWTSACTRSIRPCDDDRAEVPAGDG